MNGGGPTAGAARRPAGRAILLVLLLLSTTVFSWNLGATAASAATATATATFPLQVFRSILTEPSTGRVFVSGDDQVVVFGPGGSPLTTINNLEGADGLVAEDGFVFVAEKDAGTISVIDASSLEATDVLDTGKILTGSLAVIDDEVFFSVQGAAGGYSGISRVNRTTGAVVDHYGPRFGSELLEVPGSTTRLLAWTGGGSTAWPREIDVTGTQVSPVAYVPTSTSVITDVVFTADGSRFWANGNQLRGIDEFAYPALTPADMSYVTGDHATAIGQVGVGPGVLAASGALHETLAIFEVGDPNPTHLFDLNDRPLGAGVELAPDASVAYVVTEGSTPLSKRLVTESLGVTISAVSPSEVVEDVPASVSLTGQGLGAVETVTVGGREAVFETLSATELRVTLPPGLAAGAHAVEVETPHFGSASTQLLVAANVGAELSGLVDDGSAGVAGIEVTLTGGDLLLPMTTTTGTDGRYLIRGVPWGDDYRARFHDPSGEAVDQTVSGIGLEPNLTTDLSVSLSPTDLEPSADATIAEFHLPGRARDVVVDEDRGRVYVSAGDEVLGVDLDGRVRWRVLDQTDASQLALDGDDLYVNLHGVERISHIDLDSQQAVEEWPTDGQTSGALVFAGERLWFAAGPWNTMQLVSLDPSSGERVVAPLPFTLYGPNLAEVPGSPDSFLATNGTGGTTRHLLVDDGELVVLATNPSGTGTGNNEAVASMSADRVWTTGGGEYALGSMEPTGVQYPNAHESVAYTPALNGVLAFGEFITFEGDPTVVNRMAFDPASRAVALAPDGTRVFAGSAQDRFVVWELAPHVTSTSPPVLRPGQAHSVTLHGSGLGPVESAEVDGTPTSYTSAGDDEITLTIPAEQVPDGSGTLAVSLESAFGSTDFVLPVDWRAPDAPTDVTATAHESTVTVSWTPPAYEGTSAITSYRVEIAGIDTLIDGGATEATFEDTPVGTWSASVEAISIDGTGPAGVSNEVTTHIVPRPPFEAHAVGGAGAVWLDWWPPDSPGTAPILAYEVAPVGEDVLTSVEPSERRLFIPHMAAGVPVAYRVRARNAHGVSDWTITESATPDPRWAPYRDVPGSHPFFFEIEWAWVYGVAAGYPDGNFRPAHPVSRQEAMAFLWRTEGEPTPSSPVSFSDVPPGHPFRLPVSWGASQGITVGYANNTFRPTSIVSRQEMVAFLWRLAGSPSGPFDDPGFADVPANHPFRTAIEWAADQRVTSGFADGTFRPGAPVSRQAAVGFLARPRFPDWIPFDS